MSTLETAIRIAVTAHAGQIDKGGAAYITHPLNAYDANPVWTSDPKLTVVKDAARRTLTAGGLGSVGEKAASALGQPTGKVWLVWSVQGLTGLRGAASTSRPPRLERPMPWAS